MRYYSQRVEEYKVNRAKRNIGYAAVSTFFLTIILLDPPEFIKNIAGYLADFGIFESQLELITRDGVPPARWGGLLINLIVAAAGCVLGFAVGVVLAFSRQSKLPILKWPGIAVIETVRSGPLICWLYFAMYLLPDVADPLFTNPEDFDNIVRMMAIFSLFGGCYIAEVIRGGLQAVDSGQKEAALALGLSPTQIKLQIELPNAVRTTLPSIVSVFIGLWKDTTLLFIIEIVDFFRISKTMANTDLRFLGDFLEPVYFTAIVFWVFAFYLSRVSMGVEKGLGLVKEGGGDVA
jgi:general L-amino acid transport system permease protein